MSKLLAALALAATLATPSYAQRHRVVTPPAPPSQILFDVSPSDTIRYTNLDTKPQTIRTCVERTNNCLTDLLNPGQSLTRQHPVADLGHVNTTLEFYTQGPAEIRGMHDSIPTTLATTERQTIPVISPDQVLSVYTMVPGTAELKYLMPNGVQTDSRIINLNPGTNTIPGFTGAKQLEQYDLIPSVPTITTTNVNGIQFRAKALSEAQKEQYVVTVDPTTTVWVKNPDPTGTLLATANYLPPNTDNSNTANFTYATAINWGTTLLRQMTTSTGSLAVTGSTPAIAWSPAMVQGRNGASANAGFGETGLTKYNISLNQVPSQLALFNVSDFNGPVSGTITGYDDSGTTTGTMTYQLPTWGSTTLDMTSLKAGRILVSTDNAPNGTSTMPNVIIGANVNGINKAGYQVMKPMQKVTGDQYMKHWFDPYTNFGVFLNADDTTCLLNEQCGITGYRSQLFDILYPHSGYAGSEAQLIQLYQGLTDGNQANGELDTAHKPGRVNFTPGQMAVCFAIAPQGNLSCLTYPDSQKSAVLNVIRGYEVERANKFPQLFGGSTTTGPSMSYNYGFETNSLK